MTRFTEFELEYLASPGRLGRLATVDADGAPQNSPVGHRYNPDTGTIDIYGHQMGASRKFRNLATNDRVALVVDDLASMQPWTVRGMEIRGRAEALTDQPVPAGLSAEVIRIHPELVFTWGVDPGAPGMQSRRVGG
ncbi:MAG: PPOX class F420-dependent oxidoreductase [Mycobacteriaceae bacterium]|nr:PPOX class F420-dependent oxidoreductase [Mycobacteriaceae bacterium]